VAVLHVGACRHAPPQVGTGTTSFRIVEPAPDQSTPLSPEAKVVQATNREQYRDAEIIQSSVVMPAYPVRALEARAGAAQVGVHVVIDASGRVVDVRPSLRAPSITPPGFANDFLAAVEVAVRQWRFQPARIRTVESVTREEFTYSRVLRMENTDAAFDLSFTFTPAGKVEAGM